MELFRYKNPKDMCLMDDILMNLVFDNCPEAIQEVLRIILERDDLIITESKAQSHMTPGISERSVRLDVLAKDDSGYLYDIEVQKIKDRDLLKRAVYYSSLLNLKSLQRGKDYTDMLRSFVIFICDFDYFDKGLSMYHIDRTVRESIEIAFDYPDNIIIVNGIYTKEDPLGLLMRDFHNCNVDDVNNLALRKRLSYFKESKEGNDNMSEYIQRVYKEDFVKLKIDTRIDTTLDNAISMSKNLNIAINKVIDSLELDDEMKEKVLKKLAERENDK